MSEINFREYEYYMKNRPHVVILGAGASCAAIPTGDKYGRKISAMSGFIDKLGLNEIISKVSIHTSSDNLEDIYMELDERSKNESDCNAVKNELENVIRYYMSDFELPDEPTIYDFLVMSLTNKDLIATFNWDPFLVQAIGRIQKYTDNIPQVAEHLSLSQDTVRSWIKEGKLPVYKAGKRYKFKISEVDEWVREGKIKE